MYDSKPDKYFLFSIEIIFQSLTAGSGERREGEAVAGYFSRGGAGGNFKTSKTSKKYNSIECPFS